MGAYQVTSDSKAVRAALPIRPQVSWRKLPVSQNLICDSLRFQGERFVDFAAVDHYRRSRMRLVFLSGSAGRFSINYREDGTPAIVGRAYFQIIRYAEPGRMIQHRHVALVLEGEVERGWSTETVPRGPETGHTFPLERFDDLGDDEVP